MSTTTDAAVPAPPPAFDEALRATAMDSAATPMFVAERSGRICWVNESFTRAYGFTAAEAIGSTPRLLRSGRQSAGFYKELWRTIAAGEVWRGQLVNRKKGGELIDVSQTITPLRAADGRVTHYFAVYEDITHRLRSEQHLVRLALFDSLTGLPNRTNFQRRVHDALSRARRNDRRLAVLMLDLDRFKAVNDTLGHAAGDELLVQVAHRMGPCVRDTDAIARLSGDEFAVLIEDLARPEEAVESAQRLLEALRAPHDIGGNEVMIGASIGIALSGSLEDSPERLLQQADLAMYQAKTAGRGQFQFFDAGMDAAARRRHATEAALRTALRDDTLSIAYQPQVDMKTGEIVGAEALLRWKDPVRGVVEPEEFVALAEQTGLIFALNDWVLHRVLGEIAQWRSKLASPVPVAINLSAGHFDKVGMAGSLERLLRSHALPPSSIRIEITETVMLRPSTTVHENLRGLSRLGIPLGVDDFGIGYSSLPALREFPVDYIKLDLSYVRAIGSSRRDEQLLRAIIALGHTLGVRIVAEGVETAAQAEFLLGENCRQCQGFLYSPAVPAEELVEILGKRVLPAGQPHLAAGGVSPAQRVEFRR